MPKIKTEISGDDKKVFEILKDIEKQYEQYRQLVFLNELTVESEYEKIQLHDWTTPLNLVIKKEQGNAFLE